MKRDILCYTFIRCENAYIIWHFIMMQAVNQMSSALRKQAV